MPPAPRSAVAGDAESIGELSRLVHALKGDMHEDLLSINARLDRLEFVSPAVYAADRHTDMERHSALAARVNRIEATQQWVARTLGATIITMVAAAIWALGGKHP